MPLPHSSVRHCRLLAWACLALLLSLPLVHGHYWSTVAADQALLSYGLPPHWLPSGFEFSVSQRLLAAIASGSLIVAMMWTLQQARQAFGLFARGQLFDTRTIRHVNRFALGVVLTTVIAIVQPTLMTWLLTLSLPQEQRHIVAHLGTGHLFMLLVAALFWSLTHLMKRGAELAAENAQFV